MAIFSGASCRIFLMSLGGSSEKTSSIDVAAHQNSSQNSVSVAFSSCEINGAKREGGHVVMFRVQPNPNWEKKKTMCSVSNF